MNRRNYQKELDEIIENLERKGQTQDTGSEDVDVPRLLLHSCCAPCSSYVLEYLSDYFEITDFFYNPNIEPEEEYRHREQELDRLIREMNPKHPISFFSGRYDPDKR